MSSPKIHLYLSPGACSVAPHILLHESGLDYTTTSYTKEDVFENGGFPDELKKLNPKAKIPVATFDDEVITENPAILTFISQLAPSNQFFGNTPLETVRVYEWLNYLSGTLHSAAYGMFYRPQRFIDVEDGSLAKHVLVKARTTIQDIYSFIDEKLKGRTWAVGEEFTAADAYLYVFFRWGAESMQLDMEKEYPNYARNSKAVEERPSTQAVLKAEGLN
ncbi:hypothetical protein PMIN03_012527 [Paraphaeosphaeria minitans]